VCDGLIHAFWNMRLHFVVNFWFIHVELFLVFRCNTRMWHSNRPAAWFLSTLVCSRIPRLRHWRRPSLVRCPWVHRHLHRPTPLCRTHHLSRSRWPQSRSLRLTWHYVYSAVAHHSSRSRRGWCHTHCLHSALTTSSISLYLYSRLLLMYCY